MSTYIVKRYGWIIEHKDAEGRWWGPAESVPECDTLADALDYTLADFGDDCIDIRIALTQEVGDRTDVLGHYAYLNMDGGAKKGYAYLKNFETNYDREMNKHHRRGWRNPTEPLGQMSLPQEFDDGSPVPAQFHADVTQLANRARDDVVGESLKSETLRSPSSIRELSKLVSASLTKNKGETK
jgi:hypothetical protein